jgi:hypothetical protein
VLSMVVVDHTVRVNVDLKKPSFLGLAKEKE